MGVKIFEVLPSHPLSFDELRGRVVVIDGHLVLYQFLSSIRQPDGTPLADSHGEVTSHLQGLFSRSVNLLQKGVRLAFVFDGKAPALKIQEQARRRAAKQKAEKKLKEATKEQDIALMKKYAARTSRLTPAMVSEAKELLAALGIPVVQAPSEGEAQAAHIVAEGKAFAVGTQDADSFLFGAPRVIKNLTVSERRKAPGKLSYVSVEPERFELSEILSSLGITQQQLITLSMLVGTDYNRGGIPGIGPKKALKLVQAHKDPAAVFKAAAWGEHFSVSWQDVFDTIAHVSVSDDYDLAWNAVDAGRVRGILCERHDFSEGRVSASLSRLADADNAQRGLSQWF